MKIYPDKICIECKQALAPTLENFYKSESCVDGLSPRCKECQKEYQESYRKRKAMERKENASKWLNDFDKRFTDLSKE